MTAEAVALEFSTPAGPVVRGQRWGAGANVAILVHAPGEDLDAWADLPAHLAGRGVAAVAVDLPGHGLSDDPWEPACLTGAIEVVVRHVRDEGAARIFLVAAEQSVPGALRAGIAAGAAAFVALSPSGFEDEPDLADLRVPSLPKLLLVGAREASALAAARRIFKRCGGWTVLGTLPTREQGTRLLAEPWGGQAREQIDAFLRDYRTSSAGSGRSGR